MDKLRAVYNILSYRPMFVTVILALSGFAALMEGIGLSFVYPIFEASQSGTDIVNSNNEIIGFFSTVYSSLGINLTLGSLLAGVSAATALRYTSSFIVGWLKSSLSASYEKHLKRKMMTNMVFAKMSMFDKYGYDTIVDRVASETTYSARCIKKIIEILENISLILVYVAVMLYVAPFLTLCTFIFLGIILGFLRFILEPAVSVGTRLANANENSQRHLHAGLYGIRDVKLFSLHDAILSEFKQSLSEHRKARVDLDRNNIAMKNFYRMSAALGLFALIYISVRQTGLNLGELGIFFLAMLRLATGISTVNGKLYKLEGYLSHYERAQRLLDRAVKSKEDFSGQSVDKVKNISFDNVGFSYGNKQVLEGLNFGIKKGDSLAIVGKSGAGKSTIAALIGQLYTPSSGKIRSSGEDISNFNLREWRDHVAIVRQQAFIFDKTLRENVMMGKPEASEEEMKKACRMAQVDEFLSELPKGYDSEIGEDGAKLSGGQKQRVSIARALIKNADILILDEATSDLDSKTEDNILNSINQPNDEYGLITISHRLAAVERADSIIFLEDGQITSRGTHEELIQEDKAYQRLYGKMKGDW
jgi:subfamily B ATP-binding cassette protein MsbA